MLDVIQKPRHVRYEGAEKTGALVEHPEKHRLRAGGVTVEWNVRASRGRRRLAANAKARRRDAASRRPHDSIVCGVIFAK